MYAPPLAAARKGGDFLSDGALIPTGSYRMPNRKLRPDLRLIEAIVFELGAQGSGLLIYVLAGYITDGYSMPGRLLQLFQPRLARYLLPAILHDWLYDTGLVPRKVADLVLLHAMRAVGIPEWQCQIVYRGVRLNSLWSGLWRVSGGFNKPLPINLEVVARARTNGASEALLADLKELPNG